MPSEVGQAASLLQDHVAKEGQARALSTLGLRINRSALAPVHAAKKPVLTHFG